jgi:hypothetical protein
VGRCANLLGVALVVDELGLIVTAAPGTGSTSLLAHFQSHPTARAVPEEDRLLDGVVVVDAKHATVKQLEAAGMISPADRAGKRVVTTTRNPFDFWVAEWHRTRTRWLAELRRPDSWVYRQEGMIGRIVDAVEHDFDQWLELALGAAARAGRTMHLNAGHVAEADVVVRMEHMDDEVATLTGTSSAGSAVPHVNVTVRDRPYWQWYSAASRALVEEVHAPDLVRFGYRF